MICYLRMHDRRVPIKMPDVGTLPKMMRCAAVARMIGISNNSMDRVCDRLGVPMARAGTGEHKVRLISTEQFFKRLQEVEEL